MWTPRKQLIVKAVGKVHENGTDRQNEMAVWAVIDDAVRCSSESIRAYYHNLNRAAETRLLREVQRRAGREN